METLPYRQLVAWQKAYALAMAIVDIAESEPLRQRRDVQSQLRSAALSVPANVAEGHGRGTSADFASFVDRARGSLFEVDNWLLVCRDRSWLDEGVYQGLTSDLREVNALLFALRRRLRNEAATKTRRVT